MFVGKVLNGTFGVQICKSWHVNCRKFTRSRWTFLIFRLSPFFDNCQIWDVSCSIFEPSNSRLTSVELTLPCRQPLFNLFSLHCFKFKDQLSSFHLQLTRRCPMMCYSEFVYITWCHFRYSMWVRRAKIHRFQSDFYGNFIATVLALRGKWSTLTKRR
jgi:hypothetical protein